MSFLIMAGAFLQKCRHQVPYDYQMDYGIGAATDISHIKPCCPSLAGQALRLCQLMGFLILQKIAEKERKYHWGPVIFILEGGDGDGVVEKPFGGH